MKHTASRIMVPIIAIVAILLLSSCFPGTYWTEAEKPAGFFAGIWHGWIAPISLIGGLFDHSIRVYEQNNTGWWYDFGFYIAIISGFGGISLFRRKRDRD